MYMYSNLVSALFYSYFIIESKMQSYISMPKLRYRGLNMLKLSLPQQNTDKFTIKSVDSVLKILLVPMAYNGHFDHLDGLCHKTNIMQLLRSSTSIAI